MWVELKILSVLYCSLFTEGINQNVLTTPIYRKRILCNDTVLSELDECWNKLPEITYHGIPSNQQKIENSCSVFVSGMECVDKWSQTCLSTEAQDMLESSIIGAMQVYKWLCTNATFKDEFLQHANCYTRISTYLDACNNQFIMTLDRIDHANDVQSLCCVRLRYYQCVGEVARVLCSNNATLFLQRITNSLMETTMRTYHKAKCTDVEYKKCSSVKSTAQRSIQIVPVSQIYSIYETEYYFLFWLAYHLYFIKYLNRYTVEFCKEENFWATPCVFEQ